jgi:uracil-DNA glycosylase
MTTSVDLEEIKLKLIEKLKPSGWANKLKGFVQTSDFDKILSTLYNLRNEGKRFTPPLKHMFRAFEECPIKDLKVVVIGQDPYPHFGVADGLAFSCGLTGKPQPSLKNIFEALDLTLNEGVSSERDPDLTRWANQGVLLLNSALSCEIDKVGSHASIWKDFIMYVIDVINFTDKGIVFILLGKAAQELEDVIDGESHHILKASHPASAAYTKTIWNCEDVFAETNKIITEQNGKEFTINW